MCVSHEKDVSTRAAKKFAPEKRSPPARIFQAFFHWPGMISPALRARRAGLQRVRNFRPADARVGCAKCGHSRQLCCVDASRARACSCACSSFAPGSRQRCRAPAARSPFQVAAAACPSSSTADDAASSSTASRRSCESPCRSYQAGTASSEIRRARAEYAEANSSCEQALRVVVAQSQDGLASTADRACASRCH